MEGRVPVQGLRQARLKLVGRNLGIVALLYGAGMAAVWGFSLMDISPLVVFPVFVLGILIASLESDSGLWGALLGLGYLLSYDFLFTAPVYQLKVLGRNDAVALAIFLVVAFIMGVVTHRMRRHVAAAERTTAALRRLNRFGAELIDSASAEEAVAAAEGYLAATLGCPVAFTLGRPLPEQGQAAMECYEQHCATGCGELGYRGCREKYLPFGMRGRILGVVAIDCSQTDLDQADLSLVAFVLAQTQLAVERNRAEAGEDAAGAGAEDASDGAGDAAARTSVR